MKQFLANMWAFIVGLFNSLDKLVDKFAPVAINIVEGIKKVNENTTGDIIEFVITAAIPGTKDDVIVKLLRKKLKECLPKIIQQMNIIQSISGIENQNEQLKAILAAINMSSDETKNAYYHSFAALILQSISDKKLTWAESVYIAQYYFDNIHKKA